MSWIVFLVGVLLIIVVLNLLFINMVSKKIEKDLTKGKGKN